MPVADQQLAPFCHDPQAWALLAQPGNDVFFVLAEAAGMLKTAIDDITKMFVLTAAESKFNKEDVLAAAQRLVYKIKVHQQFDALNVQAYQTGNIPDNPIIIKSDDNSTTNDE
ncbi:hypothetical protein FQN51_007020 [Onygenales sp. PD_10]|nr:hypothetical protein FQN51_007020 [Onygenales sp. PD_10]